MGDTTPRFPYGTKSSCSTSPGCEAARRSGDRRRARPRALFWMPSCLALPSVAKSIPSQG